MGDSTNILARSAAQGFNHGKVELMQDSRTIIFKEAGTASHNLCDNHVGFCRILSFSQRPSVFLRLRMTRPSSCPMLASDRVENCTLIQLVFFEPWLEIYVQLNRVVCQILA